MEATVLKIHLISYMASLVLYLLRGGMMIRRSPWVNARALHGLVSIIAILLFASGVYLGFANKLSFADGYMMSKIVGFLLYVSLGVLALKPGLSRSQSLTLWLFGLLAFAYTYLVATDSLAPLY